MVDMVQYLLQHSQHMGATFSEADIGVAAGLQERIKMVCGGGR
jgi:hypothetical protein